MGDPVPPEGYVLWDEEKEDYICPDCEERLLRVGNYAECLECGKQFRKRDSE